MTRFAVTDESAMLVPASRDRIWDVLTDPQLLAEMTPLVDRIDDQDGRWRWHMAGFSALGVEIAPCFTEEMRFTEPTRIEFSHAPPPGASEPAGANGVYELEDTPEGTCLSVRIRLHVELPLPRMSRGAVERVMAASMRRTGDRFHDNLLQHLGIGAHATV